MENNYIRIIDNVTMFVQTPFENFDKDKFLLEFTTDSELTCFNILYAFSADKQNYSQPIKKEDFQIPPSITENYIAVYFKKIVPNTFNQIGTLYPEKNVNSDLRFIDLTNVKYNDVDVNVTGNDLRFQSEHQLINQWPKWNFYDNQLISVNRWLAQVNAINEMYGHVCIYFKTEPIENQISDTLSNNNARNVVNIKKIHISAPNNELPQDRNVYTEWDMPLQDDFVIHVIKDKFEQAFGLSTIPSEKDYLYLPIVNKLFRVATMQPKNGFMGKIGWWEVFLAKYEDDDTVQISDGLEEALSGIQDLDIDGIDDVPTEIFNQLKTFKDDTVRTKEKIDEITVDEKKVVNENFTNKLVDSTFYVSLKETEKLREFYDRRLKIVSVNPDNSTFPITMYDNGNIEKRTVALQYNLNDYSQKNKANLTINQSFEISFNFVLMVRFVGEIFDLLSHDGLLSNFTIRNSRNKLEIVDVQNQQTFPVNFSFVEKEIYNIVIKKISQTKQITIKIFSLKNKEKSLEFQDVYIITNEILPFTLTHIHLFGGNFLSAEVLLNIDEKNILKDYVNPLLQMKQF